MNSSVATTSAPTGRAASALVRLRRGNTDWRVESVWIEHFFDAQGLRLDHWIATGAATIVKTGPHRTVYRLEIPAGTFYLKHYKTSDWQARLQNLFRPCKARLEWNAAQRIADAGIPTMNPVAVGRVLTGPFVADSFLVTPEIEDVATLHDFVLNISQSAPSPELTAFRAQLARRLGELVGRLHRFGLIHRDLHAGNILMRVDPLAATDAMPQSVFLWLIDLHAVSMHRNISLRKMECNLALLANFFSHFSTSTDRLRFFQAYWRELQTVDRDAPTAAARRFHSTPFAFTTTLRRVEDHCRGAIIEAHNAADRKWSRGNRRLIIADSDTAACRGLAEFGSALKRYRDAPESLFTGSTPPEWIVQTPGARLAVTTIELNEQTVPVRVAADTSNERVDEAGRRGHFVDSSPARHAWEKGHALSRRDIDVLRPLLFVARTSASGTRREYLVVADAPRAVSLPEWLKRIATRNASDVEQRIRRAIDRLADQLRAMHTAGFRHTELDAANILVDEESSSAAETGSFVITSTRTILLGMSAVRRKPRVTRTDIASALGRLTRSLPSEELRRTHRLRLLKRVLTGGTAADWKSIWKEIAASHRSHSAVGERETTHDTTSPERQTHFTL